MSPLVGSRRLVKVNTVPNPIITNVIVMKTLAWSTLGSSGPVTRGTREARKTTAPYRIQNSTAVMLVIGIFGSRGGRFITSESPGLTVMTTTPATVTKISRNSTLVGVKATPWLMLNAVAARQLDQRQQLGWRGRVGPTRRRAPGCRSCRPSASSERPVWRPRCRCPSRRPCRPASGVGVATVLSSCSEPARSPITRGDQVSHCHRREDLG